MGQIFFASAIDNLSPERIRARYMRVQTDLQKRGHELLNPAGFYLRELEKGGAPSELSAHVIVTRDLQVLRRADLLLADVSMVQHQYVGCICEVVYAKQCGIPVIAYVGKSTIGKRPFFVYHCTSTCRLWTEALDSIDRILQCSQHGLPK